jgi:hypothetical protein
MTVEHRLSEPGVAGRESGWSAGDGIRRLGAAGIASDFIIICGLLPRIIFR